MKPSELLKEPENWTQRANARSIEGDIVRPESRWATCWCMNGALTKCSILNALGTTKLRDVGVSDIISFNDTPGRTHAEVLAKLIEAGL